MKRCSLIEYELLAHLGHSSMSSHVELFANSLNLIRPTSPVEWLRCSPGREDAQGARVVGQFWKTGRVDGGFIECQLTVIYDVDGNIVAYLWSPLRCVGGMGDDLLDSENHPLLGTISNRVGATDNLEIFGLSLPQKWVVTAVGTGLKHLKN